MSIISIPYTFSPGGTIISSQVNSCFSTIYNDYNGSIGNSNLSSSLVITDNKLAQIVDASKVSGTALTNMNSLPSGAGVIPVANIPVGTSVGNILQLVSGTTLIPQSLISNLFQIYNYGSSATTSSVVQTNVLKMAYGYVSVPGSSSVNVTGLPFTSGTSYVVLQGILDAAIAPPQVGSLTGTQFTLTNVHNDTSGGQGLWLAIGY